MTETDKEARFGGRTRYAVLAEALLEDIRSGRYPVGSLLPPELELSREFDVSRHTVREGIRRLVDLGLLSRQAGVGTKVLANRIASRYVQTGDGDLSLTRYVRDVNLRITATEVISAEGELAQFLGSKDGQGWLHLSGERFLSGDPMPIALTEIWIARPYRGVIEPGTDPAEPIYAMIERRYGLVTAEIRQTIDAVILSDEASRRLGVENGTPGLKIVRRYLSDGGETYETAVSLHPAGRFSYSSTYRVETGAPTRE